MVAKIDRTGERNYNSFGSEMIIVGYRGALDIDVYFKEYDWTFKNTRYNDFKNGKIKCLYEARVYGIGYIGEGKFKIKENGKLTKCYRVWNSMLNRCYSEKFHKRESTYKDCAVCDEWLNFQNFAEWYYKNYYEVDGERMALDKDILFKGNKLYSPETCIFVPERINTLFIKSDKIRGKYPVGVVYHKASKKFKSQCSIYDFKENKRKRIYLGLYDTSEQAFNVYKKFKEQNIKEIADYYKDKIPKKLYNAMYNYEVDIND